MSTLWKTALKNALATALYVAAVGLFMYWGGQVRIGRVNTFLVPTALLLLFVSSAAITGFLIFGQPVQMYLDGKKKEALSLLAYTLGTFFTITLISLVVLFLFSR